MPQEIENKIKAIKLGAANRLLKLLENAQPVKSRNDKRHLLELLKKKFT